MTGIHKLVIIYEDGREEVRDCPCPWCDVWRELVTPEVIARLDDAFLGAQPPVRPDWLGEP